MSKKKKNEETEVYVWNEELGNYCLAKGKNILYPLEPLRLRTINHRDSFSETLQMIFFKRYGYVNFKIGFNKDYDIALAKEMNVW